MFFKGRRPKALIVFCLLGWLSIFKHMFIFPTFDETTITGFEFKIHFNIGKGK